MTSKAARDVRLTAYDVRGRRVALLMNERHPAGVHTISWTASSLSNGVYVLVLEGDGVTARREVVLIR